jgi:hypothetical protein
MSDDPVLEVAFDDEQRERLRQEHALVLQAERTCPGCGGLQLTPGRQFCAACSAWLCGYCHRVGDFHRTGCPRYGRPPRGCGRCGAPLPYPRAKLCDLHQAVRFQERNRPPRPPRPLLGIAREADVHDVILGNQWVGFSLAAAIVGPELARDALHVAITRFLRLGPYLRTRYSPALTAYFLKAVRSAAREMIRNQRRQRAVPTDPAVLVELEARARLAERGRRVLAARP